MADENKLYFEQCAEELLKRMGLTKSQFADMMGVQRQNVKNIFETKNIHTLIKVADVLGVDISTLITPANEVPTHTVNGYLEVDGEIYKIKNIADIENVILKLND